MTFLELRNWVLYALDDLQGAYFTEPQVNRWLNQAQREVQKLLIQSGENWYTKCAQTPFVENQCDYVLPMDFLAVRLAEVVVSGTPPNEEKYMLVPITIAQKYLVSNNTGVPQFFWLEKSKLLVRPVPDDSTYTFRLRYEYRITDMVLDTDVPDIPEQYHEFIAVLAALDGFLKDGRDPSTLLAKKEMYEKMLKQDAEDRVISNPRSIVVTSNDDSGMVW